MTETTNKRYLIVSGSRDIPSAVAEAFAGFVFEQAQKRGMTIMCGNAQGVDEAVIQRCIAANWPVEVWHVVGTMRPMWPGEESVNFIQYKPGENATPKSMYVERDVLMVQSASFASYDDGGAGFLGLWNGESRGTIHTANAAKNEGVPGVLYRIDESAEPPFVIEARWMAS